MARRVTSTSGSSGTTHQAYHPSMSRVGIDHEIERGCPLVRARSLALHPVGYREARPARDAAECPEEGGRSPTKSRLRRSGGTLETSCAAGSATTQWLRHEGRSVCCGCPKSTTTLVLERLELAVILSISEVDILRALEACE